MRVVMRTQCSMGISRRARDLKSQSELDHSEHVGSLTKLEFPGPLTNLTWLQPAGVRPENVYFLKYLRWFKIHVVGVYFITQPALFSYPIFLSTLLRKNNKLYTFFENVFLYEIKWPGTPLLAKPQGENLKLSGLPQPPSPEPCSCSWLQSPLGTVLIKRPVCTQHCWLMNRREVSTHHRADL